MSTQNGIDTNLVSAELPTPAAAVTGAAGGRRPTAAPVTAAANPEMGSAPRRRRHFFAKEKLRILTDVDAAVASGVAGAVGAILRREGIYSSMLVAWRRQRETGGLAAKRGPKQRPDVDLQAELYRLRQENNHLQQRLTHAEKIIDLQKKVSDLLAIPLFAPLATMPQAAHAPNGGSV